MGQVNSQLHAIPTNIITGFLGVGKTSAILHLLEQKPETQNWAILVNEFGEIGVDGSLISGRSAESSGVFIREVPGGCMCCVAGVPMQIALNQLLTRAKPDRLIIEPTGLGHPKEVIQVLTSEHYREVLQINTNITLVDARNLRNSKYTQHETFNQQIDVADLIVGNKHDLYQDGDAQLLREYIAEIKGNAARVEFTHYGKIPLELLEGLSNHRETAKHDHHHDQHNKSSASEEPDLPETGYLQVKNSGEGFNSVGWRLSADKIFDRKSLFVWLNGFQVERAKGVFITNEGVFGYNYSAGTLTEMALDDAEESRLEIINEEINDSWELELLDLVQLDPVVI